jgi:hypothetical protein
MERSKSLRKKEASRPICSGYNLREIEYNKEIKKLMNLRELQIQLGGEILGIYETKQLKNPKDSDLFFLTFC